MRVGQKCGCSVLPFGQLKLRPLAILIYLGRLGFLLRHALIQPGDDARRLLIHDLEFLAPGIESVGAPLVSTPMPLPYSIVVKGPTYRYGQGRADGRWLR